MRRIHLQHSVLSEGNYSSATPLPPSGGNDATLPSLSVLSQCPRRCAIPDSIESRVIAVSSPFRHTGQHRVPPLPIRRQRMARACALRTLGSNMSSPTDACEVQVWCCDPHQYSVPAPCLHLLPTRGGQGGAGDGRTVVGRGRGTAAFIQTSRSEPRGEQHRRGVRKQVHTAGFLP